MEVQWDPLDQRESAAREENQVLEGEREYRGRRERVVRMVSLAWMETLACPAPQVLQALQMDMM